MNCPNCNAPMHPRTIEGITIDECSQCKGVWFDRDELRKAKDHSDPDLNWMDFDFWKHEDRFSVTPQNKTCPHCDVPMAAIDYGDTGVTVHFCPECEGTWLEEGEFEKIIHSLHEELAHKSTTDYIKASLEEAKEIVTGPESITSEWKDFTTVLRMLEYRLFVEHPKLLSIVKGLSSSIR